MLLIALGLAAAPAAAAAADQDQAAPAAIQKLLENCDAHKFETMIDVPSDGGIKHSRVKLCGTEGQSDADWLRTLRDAVAKTEANLAMPKAVRDQIVAALKTEIGRLNASSSTALTGVVAVPRGTAPPATADGYSTLPALPAPRQAPAATAPAADYAALPPLPTTPPPPTHVLAGAVGASVPLLPRPRMSFTCYTPGEGSDGPCTDFSRDTLLTVRADEDLPAGTSVRFVRNGSTQADVELAQLKQGKSMRFALPSEVCRHVTNGKLELRIVRSVSAVPGGEEVGSDGPYDLRC
jgi:hypothetical protein